jgi:pyruvate/2-oxoglutarate dehydrogenase complex dihydrolipoamide dehydrogenase (E3) component
MAVFRIGGGPIGAELGQALARLGSAVTIASATEHILPREDVDVAEVLAQQLRNEGIAIWDHCRAVWAEWHNGKKRVGLQTPQGERVIDVDEILVAAGRRSATADLGLEQVGVAHDEHGIQVDKHCRTNIPSIWAVGDVAGAPYFSHWASHQARVVVRNALFPGSASYDQTILPWTPFTQPEVARIGLSEAEAQTRGISYDLYRVQFADNDRAVCDGEAEGFTKVLTRKGRGKIIGAAIVHMHAGELLAELTVAMKYGMPLSKLASTMHVYPTLSEVHRSLGDAYLLHRATPRVRRLLSPFFTWLRRSPQLAR